MHQPNANTPESTERYLKNILKNSNKVFLPAISSWRNGWSWSASATASPAPAPLRPAGSRCPSSERSATSWRSATATPCRWSPCVPRASASPPSCGSKRRVASRSPLTRTWCTWSARPTTARRTRPLGVRAHGAACAMARRRAPKAVPWCAAAAATTRTTTRASGSATASFTGAAWSSATRAVRGPRSSRASSGRKRAARAGIEDNDEDRPWRRRNVFI